MGNAAEKRASLGFSGLDEIRQQIVAVRPELDEKTLTFQAGVLLLLGPEVRFNIDRMASRTRYPRAHIAACARRLFDHGVWRPEGPDYHWATPQDPEFWADVAVAEGQLQRRTDPAGLVEWAEAGVWRKAYDFVTRTSSLTVPYIELPARGAEVAEFREEVHDAEPVARPVRLGNLGEALKIPMPASPVALPVAEPVGAGVSGGVLRPRWMRPEPGRRSELFPDAQWLS